VIGSIISLAFILNSILRWHRYAPGMPVVGSCSYAISANCHRPAKDTDAYLLPVQWGVVKEGDGSGVKCAITSSILVRKPNEDELIHGTIKI
jgi:hypothetical protein